MNEKENISISLTPEREAKLMEKLQGELDYIKNWSESCRNRVIAVFRKYHYLFALHDLELCHTDLVKHKIKLDNDTPFKERYRCIPPHQYKEVCKHLQEMLKIGAIRKSCSPWASAVVLVRKKDGSLCFCIDL